MAYLLSRIVPYRFKNTFQYEVLLVTSLDLSCSCQQSDPGPGLVLTGDQIQHRLFYNGRIRLNVSLFASAIDIFTSRFISDATGYMRIASMMHLNVFKIFTLRATGYGTGFRFNYFYETYVIPTWFT